MIMALSLVKCDNVLVWYGIRYLAWSFSTSTDIRYLLVHYDVFNGCHVIVHAM